jgi:hypothetical protein
MRTQRCAKCSEEVSAKEIPSKGGWCDACRETVPADHEFAASVTADNAREKIAWLLRHREDYSDPFDYYKNSNTLAAMVERAKTDKALETALVAVFEDAEFLWSLGTPRHGDCAKGNPRFRVGMKRRCRVCSLEDKP